MRMCAYIRGSSEVLRAWLDDLNIEGIIMSQVHAPIELVYMLDHTQVTALWLTVQNK